MFRDENIIPLTMLKKSFLDMSIFTGSYKNIRFRYEKIKKDIDELELKIWEEDIAYDNVNKDLIHTKIFTYDDKGINNSIDYIEEYQKRTMK